MLEIDYQDNVLIPKIVEIFPRCRIEHNQKKSPSYIQGWPDLTIYNGPHWACLEVKRSIKAAIQPNQEYYINKLLSEGVFASFIYPENEKEVLNALELAFASCGNSCHS